MTRDSAIPTEGLEEILAWLNPDREVAVTMYLQLRDDLANLFNWRGCSDLEGLTDEVIDRVAKKLSQVRPTYKGDPRLYFRAVANNLVKENLKKAKTQVSLEGVDPPDTRTTDSEQVEAAADMEECLQSCLQKLSAENRKLILGYYAKEKQAKIDHRSELAQQLGISLETLRVKLYRIRISLQRCIESCLERKAQRK
ncbi:MAG TPA: sigma-70 family RNA polymerase sigma factor [Pyrinomonadaceae bacterium]|nr:sigma-70 family RNA polymerase sigma factor [Pyrinomonadaceae bacterium]